MGRYDDIVERSTVKQSNHFIVLSGVAGSGKDSVANILVDDFGYRKMSLSDEMKKFAMRLFGWSHEQLFGPSHLRNIPDPRWARPCDMCHGSGVVPSQEQHACENCKGAGKIDENSPRRVLQLLGDEWGRQMIHPDIWTLTNKGRFETLLQRGTKIVVNDARFDNDRKNLRDWFGAKIVDVRSNNSEIVDTTSSWRTHASELSTREICNADHIILNDEPYPFPRLRDSVKEMLRTLYHET